MYKKKENTFSFKPDNSRLYFRAQLIYQFAKIIYRCWFVVDILVSAYMFSDIHCIKTVFKARKND